jgi:hypothetical protein
MKNEIKLCCYCCNEVIVTTKTNKINKRTTIYDGDYYHRDCFNFEKYGKPYKTPNRKCYNETNTVS